MLGRRVISLSPDKALGKQIATALKAAGGTVDAHASLAELGSGPVQAALVAIHLAGDLAAAGPELLGRLSGDTRAIAVVPRAASADAAATLAAMVDAMQASDRLAAVVAIGDALDTAELTAIAARLLAGDIFGLEKLVPWGTLVHSRLVGDYQEKSLCIAQVGEFAEAMGVRRKYRESIGQCLDEMLMNALYDAPVDEEGKPIFADVPTKTRIALRVEQKAVVQYACDGRRFAVSVRDAFGALERGTVLHYLYKCLHAEQQIDRKAGGAGLGLYLMASSARTVYFHVLPGIATEAVCVFDLEAPRQQLEQLGFFTEKIDATGRLAAGPSRRLPAGASHPVERRRPAAPPAPPRGIVVGLSLAIAATLVLIGIVAWPRLFGGPSHARVAFTTAPPGAAIEIEGKSAGASPLAVELDVGRAYPVVARLDGYEAKEEVVEPRRGGSEVEIALVPLAASVELDSQPTGATVELAGKPAGTTPLTVTTLAPGTAVSARFAKPGYRDATVRIDVPGPGKSLRLVQPLAVAGDVARVRLVSQPPGAQVVQNGQVLAGVTTPASVLVPAGTPVRFELTMPHKVPVVLEPFVPTGGEGDLVRTAKLVDGSELRLEANVDGKVSIAGAPHCQDLALPATCTLAPGHYLAAYTGPLGAHATHTVAVAAGTPATARFELGYVAAAPGKKLRAGNGAAVTRAAFEVGTRTITVEDDAGTHTATARVTAGGTAVVE